MLYGGTCRSDQLFVSAGSLMFGSPQLPYNFILSFLIPVATNHSLPTAIRINSVQHITFFFSCAKSCFNHIFLLHMCYGVIAYLIHYIIPTCKVVNGLSVSAQLVLTAFPFILFHVVGSFLLHSQKRHHSCQRTTCDEIYVPLVLRYTCNQILCRLWQKILIHCSIFAQSTLMFSPTFLRD
ncbi:hypothetical protein, conserved [Trypanosoma brucei brucei TREU927]|uniref:Uncharacterized protein n=1 Tax=Trypanosoma brucei brucei (strain 927/4 GUTat10.1) TaxID=185431 RepID=Q380X3_TRYB2|nr:hypothetical protein, conserved [Trypanosoma brucei brucei TREU927]EAN80658.1 hypothetical protein, conserved [Trypanosoma brucei brucei TREU927]